MQEYACYLWCVRTKVFLPLCLCMLTGWESCCGLGPRWNTQARFELDMKGLSPSVVALLVPGK